MHSLTNFQKLLFILIIGISILFSNHLWKGDLLFHSDVARDFLVIDEIISTQKPTLIGPRSGGIPGVFHGPLWYYINTLPFFLSQGDPIVLGWFWWALAVLATAIFVTVTYKVSENLTVSLLAGLGFALMNIPAASGPINTYFADLFGYLVFVVWWKWLSKPSLLLASLGWLGFGLLIQFQMAFIVPISIIWLFFFIVKVTVSKKWSQLFAPFFIIPPILTFILFDLRHDWLQLKSITLYLNQDQPSLAMWERINSRLSLVLSGGMRFVTFSGWIASVILCLIGYMGYQSGFARIRLAIRLLLFWLVGWWITTLLYSGTVWTYYFSPFFNIFLFVTALVAAKSQIIRAVLGIGIFLSLIFSVANNIQSESSFDHSSWKLLQQIAQETLSHPNAGYFLYSQDQFAYSLKYAFKWVEKNDETISAFPFEKQRNTVLVKSADDPNNPYMSATLWQVQQINLNKAPDRSIVYPHGYTVEYYTLTDEEIAEPIDPNLILDLHFR